MVTTVPALIAIRTLIIHPDPEKCVKFSHVAATEEVATNDSATHMTLDGSSSKSSVHISSMIDVGKKPKHLLTCLCQGQVGRISCFCFWICGFFMAQLLPAGKVGSLRAVHTVAHINPLEF